MARRTPTPRTPLSRARVVAGAVQLADAEGIAGLSMRRLGTELGFEVMSLYNHVGGKDDLLDAMVDAVAAEIEGPSPEVTAAGFDWRTGAHQVARSAYDALLRHPWAADLWATRWPGPARWRHMESLLAVLAAAELPADAADLGFHAINAHVSGFARQHLDYAAAGADYTIDRFLAEVPADEFPLMTAHVHYHLDGGHRHDEFGFVLDLLIDGLARQKTTGTERGPRT